MTLTETRRDTEALTLTVDSEFDASAQRVWQLWSDPHQLERWWGPPSYPATVDSHDLRPGGRVAYHMTGPSGDQPRGYWDVLETNPPHSLAFRNGFANADGSPNSDMPTNMMRVLIERTGDERTRMSIETTFPSREAMEQLMAMGMEEGLNEAVGQIDTILAEDLAAKV